MTILKELFNYINILQLFFMYVYFRCFFTKKNTELMPVSQ